MQLRHLIIGRSEDEDTRRREFILNILLLGSIGLTLVAILLIVIDLLRLGETYRGIPLYYLFGPLAFFSFLYALSRMRYHYIASFLLLTIYYLLGTYSLAQWGILLAEGMLIYVLVIVMSGVLMSSRMAYATTALLGITLLGVAWLQTQGGMIPDLYWASEPGDTADAIVLTFTLMIITIVSWLSNREIERALIRARRSEAALKRERDLLEVKVEARTHELRQAQREQVMQLSRFAEYGRMASGVLHDLSTPLMTVTMNLEKLGTEERSRKLQLAIDATRHMERFIASARRQVQSEYQAETFSANEEIRQALDILDYKARKQGVLLSFSPKEECKLFGSPLRFYQVVTNLVANAIEAYDDVAEDREDRRVAITLEQLPQQVRLTIQDWGAGMSPDVLKKIWGPFFTTKAYGTGIGLPIVKETIEKELNGTIAVVSEPGRGTTFTLQFSLKRVPSQSHAHAHVSA